MVVQLSPVPRGMPGVVLAAGKGTRMQAGAPKAAVELAGRPLAARVLDALRGAGIQRIVAVIGHRGPEVRAALGDDLEFAVQAQQLGTGHALQCAASCLRGYVGPVVASYADIPLLTAGDLIDLVAHHIDTGAAATITTAVFDDPGTLGRVVRAADGRVSAIVEAKDATPHQLQIREINVGVYCFEAPLIFDILREVRNDNAQRQYYLTDAIGLLVARGEPVEAVPLREAYAGLGVDTVRDLSRAESLLRGMRARRASMAG